MRAQLKFATLLFILSGLFGGTASAADLASKANGTLLYSVNESADVRGSVSVYDIEAGHRLIKTIGTVSGVADARGVGANRLREAVRRLHGMSEATEWSIASVSDPPRRSNLRTARSAEYAVSIGSGADSALGHIPSDWVVLARPLCSDLDLKPTGGDSFLARMADWHQQ
jgi:hypothetical protein